MIRKEDDDSHHGGGKAVGELGHRWVFVDDFVSSGNTARRVFSKVELVMRARHIESEFVGAYLYHKNPRFLEARECPWTASLREALRHG